MKFWPYIYEPDRSIEVYGCTEKYFQDNSEIKKRIEQLGWIYHDIGEIIPQTQNNLWSGHYFPIMESWSELQVSFNLVCLGFYKQAFVSLRSGLELGLLSVYYNINDDGHNIVKEWLQSIDCKAANTPQNNEIWRSLLKNDNIREFSEKFNLKEVHQNLGYLHNFVHTKGEKYSNSVGLFKSNFQTFEPSLISQWLKAFEDIICLVATLHMLKYPISVIKYDYSLKYGIDIPNFGNLEEASIDRIASILPEGYFNEIDRISKKDYDTDKFLVHLESLSDLSEEEIEQQIISLEKMIIEHGVGFKLWLKQQEGYYKELGGDDSSELMKERILILRKWAEEEGFMDPKIER